MNRFQITRMHSIRHLLAACLLAVSNCAGAPETPDGFPKFSWDRVPMYAHVGLGRGLTDKQYRFLAEHFIGLCATASIASIVTGFLLMLVTISPKSTSNWGALAAGFTTQALLIAGGVVALAICSFAAHD